MASQRPTSPTLDTPSPFILSAETPVPSEFEFSDSESETDNEPLLPSSQPVRPSRSRSNSFIHPVHDARVIIGIVYAIIFVLAFGGGLMGVPCLRVFEQILCHYHYNELEGDKHIGFDEHIDESMCKGTEVQERLNFLLAGMWFLSTIPALFTTIPYGLLADRIGRKPVFALSLLGMILGGCYNFTIMAFWKVVPLHLVWASPLFIFIGGGEQVVTMMFYAIGNDVVKAESRANLFLYGGVAGIIAELIAPSLASTLMVRSPWIPILIGMGLIVFGTSLILFIPETLKFDLPRAVSQSSENDTSDNDINNISFFAAIKIKISEGTARIRGASKMLHSTPLVLLLVSFIVGPFGRVSGELSLRYISNRYGWELRQAGFLLSLRAFVSLALLGAILPLLSHYLVTRLSFTSSSKDLLLAQGSIILLVIGSGLLGAAPTAGLGITAIIILTLGIGFGALTRSLITTLVDKQHVGILYAAIAVLEVVCAMAAGPIQSALYALGLKWKGNWQGLPFFSLCFICSVAGIAVWIYGIMMRKEIAPGAIRLSDDEAEEDNVALETENSDGRSANIV